MRRRSFGTGRNGENATLYLFENKNGMRMEVTDFGATLYALAVPDRENHLRDVVLGYDDPQGYMGKSGTGFGATVGRNGNRIGVASLSLNGQTYALAKNDHGNNLHSGPDYYHHRMWNVRKVTEDSITLSLTSPDGDQGFPGALEVEVTYTLTEDNALRIDYRGVPQADTILNLTNHSYFNLNGHDSGDVLEQELWVDADAFTATDAELIPTGQIVPVAGTPMDFRGKKKIGRDIRVDYEALNFAGGYDHNWCLNNGGAFARVAELSSGESGITMEVLTDRPGVQIYSGNFLVAEPGKGGAVYRRNQGICFETQCYPDAIHHPNFPSPVCRAGQEWHTTTVYRFTRKNDE